MNFAAFFDADEQTSIDGPYVRALRFRKWAVAASAASLVVSQGLARPLPFSVGFARFDISFETWSLLTLGGLIYAGTHLALLTVQLGTRYFLGFRSRLFVQQSDEFGRIEQEMVGLRERLSGITERQLSRRASTVGADPNRTRGNASALDAFHDDAMQKVLERSLYRLGQRHQQLDDERELKTSYVVSELLIDLLRFVPPWLAIGWAAVEVLRS